MLFFVEISVLVPVKKINQKKLKMICVNANKFENAFEFQRFRCQYYKTKLVINEEATNYRVQK